MGHQNRIDKAEKERERRSLVMRERKGRKRRHSFGKTQSAHEKVGLSAVAVQAGPSQQAAPLISLINRTKSTKQMGP